MKEQITYDIFDKVDIRLGTVISVKKNEKARKPSLVIEADFGKEIGIKQSSAQITHYYDEENLKGKQVIGVCNFPEKNIAGLKSQFLVLGAIEEDGKVVLLHPSQPAKKIIINKGELFFTPPMIDHAMKFLSYTEFLTLGRGSRSKINYDEDTKKIDLI